MKKAKEDVKFAKANLRARMPINYRDVCRVLPSMNISFAEILLLSFLCLSLIQVSAATLTGLELAAGALLPGASGIATEAAMVLSGGATVVVAAMVLGKKRGRPSKADIAAASTAAAQAAAVQPKLVQMSIAFETRLARPGSKKVKTSLGLTTPPSAPAPPAPAPAPKPTLPSIDGDPALIKLKKACGEQRNLYTPAYKSAMLEFFDARAGTNKTVCDEIKAKFYQQVAQGS